MTRILIDEKVPNFTLPSSTGQMVSLSDFKDKNIVLYFYPKDNTPGCTVEAQDFKELHDQFLALDTVILGVSRDSVASHDKFKCDYEFPFELISDPEEKLCNAMGVMVDKKFFLKKIHTIERSTFLIDKKGVLRQQWRKVKVAGHAMKVLEAVRALSS